MNWKNRFVGLLLLLLPLILSVLGQRLLYDDPLHAARAKAVERLEAALAEIESNRDFSEHFARVFRRVERQVLTASEPVKALMPVLARLEQRYPRMIQGVLLDGTGMPVHEFIQRPVSRQMLQRFFNSYRRFLATGKPISSVEQGFIKSFLGRYVPMTSQIHGRFLFAAADPDRTYVYVSAPRPRGMLILFFRIGEQPQRLALQEIIRDVAHRDSELRFSLGYRGLVDPSLVDLLKVSGEQVSDVVKALDQSATGSVWLGDTLIKKRLLVPSTWVVGVTEIRRPPSLADQWPRLAVGAVLLLGGMLLFVILLEKPFAGSVRFKLIGAFLYSSLLPLIIMGFTALSSMQERRFVLERETHQQVERELFRFDQEFEHFLGELRGKLLARYFEPGPGNGASVTAFLDNLEKVEKSWRFDTCAVYDHKGNLLLEHQAKDGRPVLGNVMATLGKLARTVLDRAARRPTEEPKKSRETFVFESLSASPHLNRIEWGALKFYFGILPFGEPNDTVTHLVALLWNLSRMQYHFLADRLMTVNRHMGDGEIFAWSHTGEAPPIPGDSPRIPILKPLLGRVNSWAFGLRRRLRIGDQIYLATGLRFRLLSDYSVIRLTPDLQIRRQLNDLAWNLRFIVLSMVALCVIIGVFLSRLFLVPVTHLTRGLDALSRQEFRFRIAVEQDNELGSAARLLNQTAEDLQDLEIAKTLQETFFPTTGITVGDWRIWGRSRFAGSVGGDYVDFFSLDEQKAILIIGDVSGHGIGAALVVAMARSAFAHPMVRGDPARMMESLNTLFMRVLKRRKMMSCCLALVDAADRRIEIVNAGHQWPMLVRSRCAEFLPTQGFPLGSARNWTAGRRTEDLRDEDVLVWYSDGLVEAVDENGISVGYRRLKEEMPHLCGATPEETEARVWEWFSKTAPADPPEDDVTVLVLQRIQEDRAKRGDAS